ncbi:GntR family transcriptional regulator [Sphingomonas oleivorans]|uniref:GntR family transcriptional regulator n=1 Tax=Sphingomonas oleivorans TaxID=1735121 RepID=A0A2T5FU63_9SPHN|nr:GntR family transcriptional regulator [Sphingomonas oleivorans]PTQ07822.1 GntR family transcriptional regulator [Sphingomonas oleivorans]
MSLAEQIGPLETEIRAPLYLRLQRALRRAVESQLLKPDEALPPERDLAADFDVSRITVRKALDGLVEEGLLTRRQGAGTFVKGVVEKQFSKLTSFSEDMATRGRKVRTKWLSKSEGAVRPEEALTLGLSPGTRVFRFQRVRYADDMPMALEHSVISGFGLAGIDAVHDSLYEALQATGSRPVRALQRLRAVPFDAEQAMLLDVEQGAPGLFIERRGYLEDGRPIEMTHSWYRGDAYDFVAELNERS